MKFCEKLFELRKRRGLSQEKLAEELDVSRQAVSKWENGDAFPESAKLLAIAKYFDVTTDYLIDESQDEYTPPRLTKNIDTADKIFGMVEIFFKKHGWILGVVVCIIGLTRFISSVVGLTTMGNAISVTGNYAFGIMPVFSALTGIVIFIVGIIIIKKLKK